MIRFIIAAALTISAGAFAQGMPPAGGGRAMDPAMQKLMQAQMRIMQAQQKALEDPALGKELKALQALTEKQMLKDNPALKPKIDRFHALELEFEKMQKAGTLDPVKSRPQMQEAQKIAMSLADAQKNALKNPKVKAAFDSFDKKVRKKMAQVDPEIPALLKQLEAAGKAKK